MKTETKHLFSGSLLHSISVLDKVRDKDSRWSVEIQCRIERLVVFEMLKKSTPKRRDWRQGKQTTIALMDDEESENLVKMLRMLHNRDKNV